jgi:predicted enzyme related to lactoylglutathione lyase
MEESKDMIKKLDWVTIWSEDLNNLLPFYRDVLGMKVVEESPGFVAMAGSEEGPGVCVGTHSDVKGKATDPYRHMVGLGIDDLDAEYSRLSSAGVEFIEPPTEYGDGFRMATLKDPEGNVVQISEMGS